MDMPSRESKLQSEIIRWLKANGAYVIKARPGPGVPVGCPDIIAVCGPNWLAIEVKASALSNYQPGQEATLNHLGGMSRFVYTVWPENWPTIKDELANDFF